MIAGIGGAFIYARDAESLARWYESVLGIELQAHPEGGYFHVFDVREADGEQRLTSCVWSIFQREAGEEGQAHGLRLNYRVRDLPALLARIEERGAAVDRTESSEYGSFAWLTDPEGNQIELWDDVALAP